jgi:hypothetical protein
MQFFKPENYFEVRQALQQAGRQDLIGAGCDCLIPATPPTEAIQERRRRANDPDHYHAVPKTAGAKPAARPVSQQGYRPGRKTAQRQDRSRARKDDRRGPRT